MHKGCPNYREGPFVHQGLPKHFLRQPPKEVTRLQGGNIWTPKDCPNCRKANFVRRPPEKIPKLQGGKLCTQKECQNYKEANFVGQPPEKMSKLQ